MFKISNNVKNLLQHAMPLWKVELTSNNQNFGIVAITRGIFQGDSLSPLLFIIGLIAQDQCIRTNNIKTKIDGTRNDPKCRMCKANDETISHIISECLKLLQKEHKRRHDWMGKTVHWDICRKKSFNVSDK